MFGQLLSHLHTYGPKPLCQTETTACSFPAILPQTTSLYKRLHKLTPELIQEKKNHQEDQPLPRKLSTGSTVTMQQAQFVLNSNRGQLPVGDLKSHSKAGDYDGLTRYSKAGQ
ncbi:hypothetical protein HD554DRAFT_2037977 [Boletus coccyginus]|nr:hypothetical protein HD554DRAFT_2037977 [Boletus coccyginus]